MSFIGKKYGRLTIISEPVMVIDNCGKKRKTATFLCDCGKSKDVQLYSVKAGHTTSCGCLQMEIAKDRKMDKNPNWKGDRTNKPTLHSWINGNFEKPICCELCNRENDGTTVFDWSNKDHKYSRIRSEWQYICRKCHTDFDIKNNGRPTNHYLNRKYIWSLHHPCCVDCKRDTVKFRALGRCHACYNKHKAKTKVDAF